MQLAPAFSENGRSHACSLCGGGPGKTGRTNKSPDRPVVTTNVDIDFEGIFEFCLNCAAEAGGLAGMIPEQIADEIREENAHLNSQNQALLAERNAARKALELLTAQYAALSASPEPVADAAA